MGLPDVFEVQDRLLDEGIAHSGNAFVVTHFSHNGLLLHEEIEALCVERGILVAYDGMELVV